MATTILHGLCRDNVLATGVKGLRVGWGSLGFRFLGLGFKV